MLLKSYLPSRQEIPLQRITVFWEIVSSSSGFETEANHPPVVPGGWCATPTVTSLYHQAAKAVSRNDTSTKIALSFCNGFLIASCPPPPPQPTTTCMTNPPSHVCVHVSPRRGSASETFNHQHWIYHPVTRDRIRLSIRTPHNKDLHHFFFSKIKSINNIIVYEESQQTSHGW